MENVMKRERSTNFNKGEVRLLIEFVSKHCTIIENKKTDAVTNKEKEAAWNKIAALFNAATGLTARSAKSLKFKYESIKKETKKTMAKHRQELYKTGGGPSSGPDLTDIEEKVMAICSNITGLDSRNDSDSLPEPKVEKTAKVATVTLPLQPLETKIVIVSCNDDIPFTLDKDDLSLQDPQENINYETENDVFDAQEPVQNDEAKKSEKENNWSSWNSKALKSKISPRLKPVNQKVSREVVTTKLDQLSNARLELVELQKEIATKEHELVNNEYKLKMQNLQNDEKRKQQIHEILVRQLNNRLHYEMN